MESIFTYTDDEKNITACFVNAENIEGEPRMMLDTLIVIMDQLRNGGAARIYCKAREIKKEGGRNPYGWCEWLAQFKYASGREMTIGIIQRTFDAKTETHS